MAVVDLKVIGDSAIESVRAEAERRGLHLFVDTRPVKVAGDASRLQQVVVNLLNNAVQFTPPDGRVLLTIEPAEGQATIKVQDTGIGIDAAFLPLVFDQFQQGPAPGDRSYGGLGLGLSITRRLVEMHGGNIVAESAGHGRGAVFTVILPLAPADPSSPAPAKAETPPPSSKI